ncbi:MAG: DUF177 domain-containing protein [Rhodospirillales bacterium]|nr:DUF177 domain-containing protein [Rhodospirillales bacterium]USO07959.1 MAG: DUF177 domain-containing protein [Rhodospirillales bacterium]
MASPVEFSVCVPAARIAAAEDHIVRFAADEKARALLARRLGVEGVDVLEGETRLRRQPDGMTIHAQGTFRAEVTQACVTTLEPVRDSIAETFEGWYLDESQASSFARARRRQIEVDAGDLPPEEGEMPVPDEREDPEPVVGGVIDVGELVAQHLSLAINPYPHSAAALAAGPVGDEKSLEKPSPFAVLKALKEK